MVFAWLSAAALCLDAGATRAFGQTQPPKAAASVAESTSPPQPQPLQPVERKRVDLLLHDPRLGTRDTLAPPGSFGEVRRNIEKRFRPTRTLITEDSKPAAALQQLQNNPVPMSGPNGRKQSLDPNIEVQEATEEAQRAYERPTRIRSVEVAFMLDARGRISDEKIVQPSGSTRFDAAALEAAHAAFADSDLENEGQAVVLRFRIRAGYGVTLPRALPLLAPRTPNGRVPSRGPTLPMPIHGTFDESRGTAQVHHAFEDKIEIEVNLLSVTPLAPGEP